MMFIAGSGALSNGLSNGFDPLPTLNPDVPELLGALKGLQFSAVCSTHLRHRDHQALSIHHFAPVGFDKHLCPRCHLW